VQLAAELGKLASFLPPERTGFCHRRLNRSTGWATQATNRGLAQAVHEDGEICKSAQQPSDVQPNAWGRERALICFLISVLMRCRNPMKTPTRCVINKLEAGNCVA
jgi:hypothetical protein